MVCEGKAVIDGGNIAIYKTLMEEEVGEDKCEEYTRRSFMSGSGVEFVALELISDWGRKAPLDNRSPLLDPDVTILGISMKPS